MNLFFILLEVVALQQVNQISVPGVGVVGPRFFPMVLVIAMLALSVIDLLRSFVTRMERVPFENKKHILILFVLTLLLLVLWSFFHKQFFIWLFVFICGVFAGFQDWKINNIKMLLTGFGLAAGVTLFIYVLFAKIMMVNF